MLITVNCKCGKEFRVSDQAVGKRVKCPVCAMPNSVPERAPLAQVLQEDEMVTVTPKKQCPSCGTILERPSVICLDCGHDFRTSKAPVAGASSHHATDVRYGRSHGVGRAKRHDMRQFWLNLKNLWGWCVSLVSLIGIVIGAFIVCRLSVQAHKDAETMKLIAELNSMDQRGAAAALVQRGSQAVPFLIKGLRDASPLVRYGAADVLGRLGRTAGPAVPALRESLKHENEFPAEAMAAALGQIGPDAELAVPDLIEATRHKRSETRTAAARALTVLAQKDAVVLLVGMLKEDQEIDVRAAAANCLGRIGPAAKGAVPDLIDALRQEDRNLRAAAAQALGGVGPDASAGVPALIDALREEATLMPAAVALGNIGPAARSALPALRDSMKLASAMANRRANAPSNTEQMGTTTITEYNALREVVERRVLGARQTETRSTTAHELDAVVEAIRKIESVVP